MRYRLTLLLLLSGWLVACDGGEPSPPDAAPIGPDASAPDAGASDAGASDAGATDAGALDAGPIEDAGGDGPGGGLDAFEDTVATAQCAAIFRCCATDDLAAVFEDYRSIPGLPSPFDALQDRIPPEATLTEESCVDLMRDLNAIAPFGQWLVEARAGRVGFDEAAYAACLEDLATAECGRPLEEALNDTSCFALRSSAAASPGTETVHRSFFVRPGEVDDACTALEEDDAAYGTCDPASAFCCRRSSPAEDCGPVAVGGDGTCVAVAGEGEECSAFPPLPCAEGLRCRAGASLSDPSRCEPVPDEAVGLGEVCAMGFVTTAACAEGYCDTSTDPGRCTAHRADGEPCDTDPQCASANCAGEPGARTCAPFDRCVEAS